MKFYYLLLISCFILNANGQSIRGKVIDKASNIELLNVKIIAKQDNVTIREIVSDSNGFFIISPLKPGFYDICFLKDNYKIKIIKGVVISPSKSTQVEGKLNKVNNDLVEIEEEAYKYPRISRCESRLISESPFKKTNVPKPIREKYSIANLKRKEEGRLNVACGESKYTIMNIDGVRCVVPLYLSLQEEDNVQEALFLKTLEYPKTSFSTDVLGRFYNYLDDMLNVYSIPPKQSIRIEEMINHFDYDYPNPENELIHLESELSICPWNRENQLLHIGLQSHSTEKEHNKRSNLVFVIDLSWSMNTMNKLPLIKQTLRALVSKLDTNDNIAIITYADTVNYLLESTSCDNKNEILSVIDSLKPNGFFGASGLELAYKVALDNYIDKGSNKIIMATDGVFNFGLESELELEQLIIKQKETGVSLSILGYEMQTYRGDKLKKYSKLGKGHYAYIDTEEDINDFLVNGIRYSHYTLASEVNISIKFNSNYVQSYRLIGYANKPLQEHSYNGDLKPKGQLETNQSVTALYEIIPADQKSGISYQNRQNEQNQDELYHMNITYNNTETGRLDSVCESVNYDLKQIEETSDNYRFSASVAMFGLILRDSKFKKKARCGTVIHLAQKSCNDDLEKINFINLVKKYRWSGTFTSQNIPKHKYNTPIIDPYISGDRLTRSDIQNSTTRNMLNAISEGSRITFLR